MKLDINNYPGSKGGNGVPQWIINHVPEFWYCIDMLAGSGIVGETIAELTGQKIVLCEKYQPVARMLGDKHRDKHNFFVKWVDSIEFYIDLISEGSTFEGYFFYFDPPYLKSERRSDRNIYGCEWSEADHMRMFYLIELLCDQGAHVMISHYDCELYCSHLKNWKTSEFKTMTRGGAAIEKIWMNYDISKLKLASTAFIGKNFTDRQRIKRKKEKFVRKLNELPIHEKQAVLEYIQKHL